MELNELIRAVAESGGTIEFIGIHGGCYAVAKRCESDPKTGETMGLTLRSQPSAGYFMSSSDCMRFYEYMRLRGFISDGIYEP